MTLRFSAAVALAAAVWLSAAASASAADKIKLLIIDGQNNHNWQAMTPPMHKALEATGRFEVDTATTPPKGAKPEAWKAFQPDFSKYQVVLSNYNGELWPENVRKGLETFVSDGGGLVIIHAANNAFPEWSEWNKMIGLGWRGPDYGDRITIGDDGKQVRTPKGEGPGAGHGPRHSFVVKVLDPGHPVMKGMPAEWLHTTDELYHGQRGPGADMTVLASAYSAKNKGGTGANEPMVWTIPYGKGRVFTTVLGHVMGDDLTGIQCVGFLTLMNRGCEWAAGQEVSLPLPKDFPAKNRISAADLK